ncbi:MAG: DNA mismatch repair protein MutS [Candidatus Bipolaricaulota bacterium]|nr:DNA mismatch repair protein MutS [Candidatus Bipolaricaulota bacterium]MDW8152243.1 DNA mismatch repair protein MutS [Candidatus Bipolaricaulota bacterium]
MEGELTPMMRQYRDMKARYPEAILFFQLGDFYETFFEDAELVSRELEITLTSRDGVPMAGVPVRRAEFYVQKLLKRGYKVALCPQLEPPGKGRRLLKRAVVRVLTPGTVIEEGALEADRDVLLAAVWPEAGRAGMAWAEAASGAFFAEELPWDELPNLAARLSVAEWLLPEGVELPWRPAAAVTPRPPSYFQESPLFARFPGALAGAPLAAKAAGALLRYLGETLGELPHLRPPTLRSEAETMVLDAFTQRSLELVEPLRPEGKLTLLSVLDRTKTPMGRRLLRRWVLSPLRERAAIEARLDSVEILISTDLWARLEKPLSRCHDLPRLLSPLGMGHPSPLHLLALARTLAAVEEIARILGELPEPLPEPLRRVREALERAPLGLVDLLRRALVDHPPPSLEEGGVLREGFDERLDALRAEIRKLREELALLEARERERTGIPNLRIGYNRVFGYFFEVTRGQLSRVPKDWQRRQSLTGAERFTSPELSALADRLLGAEEEALNREAELFQGLVAAVQQELGSLGVVGEALAELDALRSLAEVAHKKGYTRPRFTEARRLRIREGRHPVVEETVTFVPNDLVMDERTHLALVTGPNMAGKSVFLRQVALIALLAQMGSFVPAKEAELPLFDKIFTRVGASDAVAEGISTFMAEMQEAAGILAGATANSLVILDELGRGTSTHDGMALAWAIAKHLAEKVRCKTLFATHYRELADLAEALPGVMNLHAAAREWKGEVVFLYRILPGVAEKSYGIQVAKLARLPPEVLAEAERKLAELEKRAALKPKAELLPLFGPEEHPVLAELRRLIPEKLTPLEALALLFQLKEKL